MNIRLYGLVLRRHWVILTVGFLLGLALTIMSAVTIKLSPLKASWKLKPTYGVSSILLVTQPGFPVGRANLIQAGAPTDAAGALISTFADPSRYDYLAGLYAQLATSDAVLNPVLGKTGFKLNGLLYLDGGKAVGTYTAAQLPDSSGNGTLPFVEIDATAKSASEVKEIGSRVTDSLIRFVSASESGVGIAGKQRVILTVVQAPDSPRVIKGRGLVLPLAVFILCLAGAVALAFLRENFKRDELEERSGLEPSVISTVRPPTSLRRDTEPSPVRARSDSEHGAAGH